MREDIGKLILRIMLGGMMLFHGIDKALHGITFIKGLIVKQGLPEELAYGVYIGEILAPLFLILGWKSRFWAGIIAFNMLVAFYLIQVANLLKVGDNGAWAVEVTMFYLLTAISIMFLGSGKYAVMKG
ncbi:MAG: DoxX family protein [Sulfurovum sp.]|nr:DoxX family protein [Sulfurovum sp.]